MGKAGDVQAPVASGAEAPPSAAPEVSVEAPDPVDTTETGPLEEDPVAEPEVTADTFGWDEWDGNIEGLPEAQRPWATKLSARYDERARAAEQSAEEARRVYEAIYEGREDPRIAEYRTKLDEANGWKSKHDEAVSAHEKFKSEINSYFEAQARAAVDKFKAENAWIFESDELKTLGYDLLEDGFAQGDLPHLLRMNDQQLGRVRTIMKDLTSRGAKDAGEYAIKLAVSEFRAPAPNPSASLVAGANPANDRTGSTKPSTPDASETSLADLTKSSLAKNLRLMRK